MRTNVTIKETGSKLTQKKLLLALIHRSVCGRYRGSGSTKTISQDELAGSQSASSSKQGVFFENYLEGDTSCLVANGFCRKLLHPGGSCSGLSRKFRVYDSLSEFSNCCHPHAAILWSRRPINERESVWFLGDGSHGLRLFALSIPRFEDNRSWAQQW